MATGAYDIFLAESHSPRGGALGLAGSGGRPVERRTVNREDGGSIPPTAVSKLRQFRSSHICLCLSEDKNYTKSWWSLLSGVYARGSKRSTQGVNV